MIKGNYILGNRQIVWIVLSGSIVRAIFGWHTRSWMEAPDQLAWQLGIDAMIDSGKWDYRLLMHAPHEGGTLVLGFLSVLLRPLPLLPSLSWSALVFDTIARFVQIRITQKIFGGTVAAWFGLWSVLAIPALIPWGTVNFGLHALSSLFPFLVLYIIHRYRDHAYMSCMTGIACAVSVSFSYDSLVLLPVCVLFFLNSSAKNRIRNIVVFCAVFAIAMLPHIWMRAGMHTQDSNDLLLSVRSVVWQDVLSGRHLINILPVWLTALPGSFIVSPVHVLPPLAVLVIVCLLLFSGIALFIFTKDRGMIHWAAIAMILFFVTAYAISPFYGGRYDNASYKYYRHMGYIVPLLALVCTAGYNNAGALKKYLLPVWISVCGLLSIQFMFTVKRSTQPAYRSAGWISISKYADNKDLLLNMHAVAGHRYQTELMTGYGWGLSALLLTGKADTASVKKLVQVIRQYPAPYHQQLMDGVRYSFAKNITPILDPGMLEIFNLYMERETIHR